MSNGLVHRRTVRPHARISRLRPPTSGDGRRSPRTGRAGALRAAVQPSAGYAAWSHIGALLNDGQYAVSAVSAMAPADLAAAGRCLQQARPLAHPSRVTDMSTTPAKPPPSTADRPDHPRTRARSSTDRASDYGSFRASRCANQGMPNTRTIAVQLIRRLDFVRLREPGFGPLRRRFRPWQPVPFRSLSGQTDTRRLRK